MNTLLAIAYVLLVLSFVAFVAAVRREPRPQLIALGLALYVLVFLAILYPLIVPPEPEPGPEPDPAVLMSENFEDYPVGVIQSGDPNFNPSYAEDDACKVVETSGIEGGKSTRCETKQSKGGEHYRSELKVKSPQDGEQRQGNETWVGVRIRLGEPYATVSEYNSTVLQFHTTESIEGDPTPDCLNQNPPAHLYVRNGEWRFTVEHSLCKGSDCKATQENESWELGAVAGDVGKNTDWVVHVKWDARTSDPAGRVELWKNGERRINATLPLGFDCGTIPYLKIGIYATAYREDDKSGPDWLVNHDALKIAGPGASYETVAPSR